MACALARAAPAVTDAWKKHDLGGGGLQQANLRLARALRRRGVAYLLLLLFPAGAHRFYLRQPLGGALFIGLTGGVLLALHAGNPDIAWTLFGIQLGFALFDLVRMERRLTGLNKALRMKAYLRAAPGAPRDFRGHYTDGPDEARAAVGRTASFAEQERQLAELARKKRDGG